MRRRLLLAAILLGVVLCFVVSGVGYGEVEEWMNESKTSYIESYFLDARIDYMMLNPTNFFNVNFWYDWTGLLFPAEFPQPIDTKGKIVITIYDNRDWFSFKSGINLLDSFKRTLEVVYSFITSVATDMNADVVAGLYSREGIPLAYFYQGEYHLWED